MGVRHLLSFSCSPPTLSLLLLLLSVAQCGYGRKVGFLQNFRVTWSGSHVRQLEDGSSIQLSLDQSSGSGFASKDQYMFGRVSMRIKLIPGDSAGTVTAFYMSSDKFDTRDELDFEFLGNRTGQPITVQTNVYANGFGNREQRVNLWFDPSLDFHNYTIFWNRAHAIFLVDDVPIRVYKNNMDRGVPYPISQPMRVVSTLWNADNWATRGGLEKIDWKNAPFHTYYRDFDIEGCVVPGPAGCAQNPRNWWDEPTYLRLNPVQARKYRWVRLNYMIYDYCRDTSRYPVPPPECTAGI
ncbi:probable xyloglucan endotransglucosylase/hydrolase protein 6 [Nymphaea colorata]|nr:probable xyloglucan endotransglucosylase/hydrolase protein 6 [Nymphaea colorata]